MTLCLDVSSGLRGLIEPLNFYTVNFTVLEPADYSQNCHTAARFAIPAFPARKKRDRRSSSPDSISSSTTTHKSLSSLTSTSQNNPKPRPAHSQPTAPPLQKHARSFRIDPSSSSSIPQTKVDDSNPSKLPQSAPIGRIKGYIRQKSSLSVISTIDDDGDKEEDNDGGGLADIGTSSDGDGLGFKSEQEQEQDGIDDSVDVFGTSMAIYANAKKTPGKKKAGAVTVTGEEDSLFRLNKEVRFCQISIQSPFVDPVVIDN